MRLQFENIFYYSSRISVANDFTNFFLFIVEHIRFTCNDVAADKVFFFLHILSEVMTRLFLEKS